MRPFVNLTTIKFVSKNGNVFRIPKVFVRYLRKVVSDEQSNELIQSLIDYICEQDISRMTELIGKFTDNMFEEDFLDNLNRNTNQSGVVDWDTFFKECK